MTQNHKCHLSRSSGGVGWKAGDFQRRNSCYKTIASGFGSVEHLQMVAPAHDSCFWKRICPNQMPVDPINTCRSNAGFFTENTNPIYLEAQAELGVHLIISSDETHVTRRLQVVLETQNISKGLIIWSHQLTILVFRCEFASPMNPCRSNGGFVSKSQIPSISKLRWSWMES